MLSVCKAVFAMLPFVATALFPQHALSQSQISAAMSHKITGQNRCAVETGTPSLSGEEKAGALFGERSGPSQVCDVFSTEAQARQLSANESKDAREARAAKEGVLSFSRSSLSSATKVVSAPVVSSPFGSLRDVGLEGTSITRARQGVFEILRTQNACSAWFHLSDPQITETFLSLIIEVDEDGPNHIIKELNDREIWFEHGPYIARTRQSTGPGGVVTINGNGAFFRKKGEVFQAKWLSALPTETGTWRALHVGPYDGATLPGQVIVLLHELAHVVGAIPADDSAAYGFALSPQNTDVILRHCKRAADSSRKHPSFDSLRTAAD